ncbi:MAG: hypothetical protein V1820_01225 [archaeon]
MANRKTQANEMPMTLVWIILGLIGLAIVALIAMKGKDLFRSVLP